MDWNDETVASGRRVMRGSNYDNNDDGSEITDPGKEEAPIPRKMKVKRSYVYTNMDDSTFRFASDRSDDCVTDSLAFATSKNVKPPCIAESQSKELNEIGTPQGSPPGRHQHVMRAKKKNGSAGLVNRCSNTKSSMKVVASGNASMISNRRQYAKHKRNGQLGRDESTRDGLKSKQHSRPKDHNIYNANTKLNDSLLRKKRPSLSKHAAENSKRLLSREVVDIESSDEKFERTRHNSKFDKSSQEKLSSSFECLNDNAKRDEGETFAMSESAGHKRKSIFNNISSEEIHDNDFLRTPISKCKRFIESTKKIAKDKLGNLQKYCSPPAKKNSSILTCKHLPPKKYRKNAKGIQIDLPGSSFQTPPNERGNQKRRATYGSRNNSKSIPSSPKLGNPQCHAKKTTKLKNNENNRNKTFGLNLSKHNGENKRHTPKGIRSSRRTRKNKNCVITIISSDEDDGDESEALVEDVYAMDDEEEQIDRAKAESLQQQQPDHYADRIHLNVVRIAIGNKVSSSNCKVEIQLGTHQPHIRLSYDMKENSELHKIDLSSHCIPHMWYYLVADDDCNEFSSEKNIAEASCCSSIIENNKHNNGNNFDCDRTPSSFSEKGENIVDDHVSFLAMRIKPSDENGLSNLTSSYDINYQETCTVPGENKPESKLVVEKKYVVIELRSESEFINQLQLLKKSDVFRDAQSLELDQTPKFTAALVYDSIQDKNRRLSSQKHKRSKSRINECVLYDNDPEKILLIYPFVGADVHINEEIEKVASTLKEAKGSYLSDNAGIRFGKNENTLSNFKASSNCGESVPVETRLGRTHYLTIRGEDRDRLHPGEYLNDTLIDFWMRWIWRKEIHSTSSVHFFTSHFFTTLHEEGPRAVASWTAKKNIDIFSKRFIFLPINRSLHWSLCVVVNPGHIDSIAMNIEEKNGKTIQNRDAVDQGVCDAADAPLSCIIFLDSLKAHKKNLIAKAVREWLNQEWARLKKSDNQSPFSPVTMKVYDPKIPYQSNGWDCGVFICRYAYGLYQRRDRLITCKDLENGHFKEAITDSPEFDFSSDDIKRIRREMLALIGGLSDIYIILKTNEAMEKRRRKEKRIANEGKQNGDKLIELKYV
eukprot:CAMPEP_0194371010 /NCGR_PEP_ID=MMETSP0174-20130528/19348_1 /TAXON_ID=216777 /ORGANISM="Proboscia alata, Strain PI-D3" /LENGTH=1104 /DNA_ID=CAMNT_0039148789 /DNA_START=158 /DNA_END=3472 /DNA_ORIENTATION=-